MDVYMIRHGESESNADGTHAGWAPVRLTEKGRAQAAMARRYVETLSFDRLFVSDVLRAQQTADIIFPGMARTFLPIAREMNNTNMRGKTPAQMAALYPEIYPACRAEFDYAPLGMDCESRDHFSDRAQSLLDMMAALPDANRVAVVSHAGLIRAAAARILGLPHHTRELMCHNASISVFHLDESGWRVRMWNLSPELP